MAHFAELDANNIVLRVIVVGNEDCLDSDGNESEAVGVAFCKGLFGSDTNWVQTSYNRRIRGSFAGIGNTYDPIEDKFFSPQPFPSWTLDKSNNLWSAPVPKPNDNPALRTWRWDEDGRVWVVDWQSNI